MGRVRGRYVLSHIPESPFRSTAASSIQSDRLVHRLPFHCGWMVLAVAVVGMAATLPAQTAGTSLFIDAFIDELGLLRTAVSWAYTVATVLGRLVTAARRAPLR